MNKVIKVGGSHYEIILKDLNTREDDKNGQQLGWCVIGENKIEVNNQIAYERQAQTLVHELMHAIFFEAGLNLENEEDLVNRIGLILYQVLKDNDFTWIREVGEGGRSEAN